MIFLFERVFETGFRRVPREALVLDKALQAGREALARSSR
jgi:hypothetical protein